LKKIEKINLCERASFGVSAFAVVFCCIVLFINTRQRSSTRGSGFSISLEKIKFGEAISYNNENRVQDRVLDGAVSCVG